MTDRFRAVGFTEAAAQYPRDALALRMFAAFNGVTVDQLPDGFRYFPNESTAKAWARVAAAVTPVAVMSWQPIETLNDTTERLIIIGSYNGRGQWVSDIWSTEALTREQERNRNGFYKNTPHLAWNPTHYAELPPAPQEGSAHENG